jgi:hypothetical protein
LGRRMEPFSILLLTVIVILRLRIVFLNKSLSLLFQIV